jgi:hypothetical protein
VSGRYEGRPVLRLVEAYVLDRLDLLDPGSADSLAAMAPKLASSLGSSADTWQGVVADALDLHSDCDDAVRRDWERMITVDPELEPQHFAQLVADSFMGDDA